MLVDHQTDFAWQRLMTPGRPPIPARVSFAMQGAQAGAASQRAQRAHGAAARPLQSLALLLFDHFHEWCSSSARRTLVRPASSEQEQQLKDIEGSQ